MASGGRSTHSLVDTDTQKDQKAMVEKLCIQASNDSWIPMLLVGESGCGKTATVRELAKTHEKPFVRANLSKETDVAALFGSSGFVARDGSPKLTFCPGLFSIAWEKGYVLLLDEINMAPEGVLASLSEVLSDNVEYLSVLDDSGEGDGGVQRIKRNGNFRLVATMNPTDAKGFGRARRALSRSLLERFHEVHFNPLGEKDKRKILAEKFGNKEAVDGIMDGLENCAIVFKEAEQEGKERGNHLEVTLRDALEAGEACMQSKTSGYKIKEMAKACVWLRVGSRVLHRDVRETLRTRMSAGGSDIDAVAQSILDSVWKPKGNIVGDLYLGDSGTLRRALQVAVWAALCCGSKGTLFLTPRASGASTLLAAAATAISEARESAETAHWELFATAETGEEDIVGGLCLGAPKTDTTASFRPGAATLAASTGGVLCVHDLHHARPEAIERLNPLLEHAEERKWLISTPGVPPESLDEAFTNEGNVSKTITLATVAACISPTNPLKADTDALFHCSPALFNRFIPVAVPDLFDSADQSWTTEQLEQLAKHLGVEKHMAEELVRTWGDCVKDLSDSNTLYQSSAVRFGSFCRGVKELAKHQHRFRDFKPIELAKIVFFPIEPSNAAELPPLKQLFAASTGCNDDAQLENALKTAQPVSLKLEEGAPRVHIAKRVLLADLCGVRGILLEGPAATGKTQLLRKLHAARKILHPSIADLEATVTSSDTSWDVFVGQPVPRSGPSSAEDASSSSNLFDFAPGPILRAATHAGDEPGASERGEVFLDEINQSSKPLLQHIESLLGRSSDNIPNPKPFAHPSDAKLRLKSEFRIFAAQNRAGKGYIGRRNLSPSMYAHFAVVPIEPLSQEDMQNILQDTDATKKMCQVAQELQARNLANVTIRELFRWKNRAGRNIGDLQVVAHRGLDLFCAGLSSDAEVNEVKDVFVETFGRESVNGTAWGAKTMTLQVGRDEVKFVWSDDDGAQHEWAVRGNTSTALFDGGPRTVQASWVRTLYGIAQAREARENVLVVGEPGTGKSLLLESWEAFRASVYWPHLQHGTILPPPTFLNETSESADLVGRLRLLSPQDAALYHLRSLRRSLEREAKSTSPPSEELQRVQEAIQKLETPADLSSEDLSSTIERFPELKSVCSASASDTPLVFQCGPAVEAAERLSPLVIRHVDSSPPAAVERLNHLLEPAETKFAVPEYVDKPSIDLVVDKEDETGASFPCRPMVLGTATDTSGVSLALQSRMTIVHLPTPTADECIDMLDISPATKGLLETGKDFLLADITKCTSGRPAFYVSKHQVTALHRTLRSPRVWSRVALLISDQQSILNESIDAEGSKLCDAPELEPWKTILGSSHWPTAVAALGMAQFLLGEHKPEQQFRFLCLFLSKVLPNSLEAARFSQPAMDFLNLELRRPRPIVVVRPGLVFVSGAGVFLRVAEDVSKIGPSQLASTPETDRLVRAVCIAAAAQAPLQLSGPPAVGKTEVVRALAAQLSNHGVERCNFSANSEPQDVTGTSLPGTIDGRPVLRFIPSSILAALSRGQWGLLDEPNLAPPYVLSSLLPFLSEAPVRNKERQSRTYVVPDTNRVVSIHPNARIFLALNPPSFGGRRRLLPPHVQARLTNLAVTDLRRDDLPQILIHTNSKKSHSQHPFFQYLLSLLVEHVVNLDIACAHDPELHIALQSAASHSGLARRSSKCTPHRNSPPLFDVRAWLKVRDILNSLAPTTEFYWRTYRRSKSDEENILQSVLHSALCRATSLALSSDAPPSVSNQLSTVINNYFDKLGVAPIEPPISPPSKEKTMFMTPSALQIAWAFAPRSSETATTSDDPLKSTFADESLLLTIENILLGLASTKPVLVMGPPQSGKTRIVQCLQKLLNTTIITPPGGLHRDTDTRALVGRLVLTQPLEEKTYEDKLTTIIKSIQDTIPSESSNKYLSSIKASDQTNLYNIYINLLAFLHKRQVAKSELSLKELANLWDAAQDLRALFARKPRASNTPTFAFVESPLVQAIRKGHLVVLDGTDRAPSSVIERLNSLLERRATLALTEQVDTDPILDEIEQHLMSLDDEELRGDAMRLCARPRPVPVLTRENGSMHPDFRILLLATNDSKDQSPQFLTEPLRSRVVVVPISIPEHATRSILQGAGISSADLAKVPPNQPRLARRISKLDDDGQTLILKHMKIPSTTSDQSSVPLSSLDSLIPLGETTRDGIQIVGELDASTECSAAIIALFRTENGLVPSPGWDLAGGILARRHPMPVELVRVWLSKELSMREGVSDVTDLVKGLSKVFGKRVVPLPVMIDVILNVVDWDAWRSGEDLEHRRNLARARLFGLLKRYNCPDDMLGFLGDVPSKSNTGSSDVWGRLKKEVVNSGLVLTSRDSPSDIMQLSAPTVIALADPSLSSVARCALAGAVKTAVALAKAYLGDEGDEGEQGEICLAAAFAIPDTDPRYEAARLLLDGNDRDVDPREVLSKVGQKDPRHKAVGQLLKTLPARDGDGVGDDDEVDYDCTFPVRNYGVEAGVLFGYVNDECVDDETDGFPLPEVLCVSFLSRAQSLIEGRTKMCEGLGVLKGKVVEAAKDDKKIKIFGEESSEQLLKLAKTLVELVKHVAINELCATESSLIFPDDTEKATECKAEFEKILDEFDWTGISVEDARSALDFMISKLGLDGSSAGMTLMEEKSGCDFGPALATHIRLVLAKAEEDNAKYALALMMVCSGLVGPCNADAIECVVGPDDYRKMARVMESGLYSKDEQVPDYVFRVMRNEADSLVNVYPDESLPVGTTVYFDGDESDMMHNYFERSPLCTKCVAVSNELGIHVRVRLTVQQEEWTVDSEEHDSRVGPSVQFFASDGSNSSGTSTHISIPPNSVVGVVVGVPWWCRGRVEALVDVVIDDDRLLTLDPTNVCPPLHFLGNIPDAVQIGVDLALPEDDVVFLGPIARGVKHHFSTTLLLGTKKEFGEKLRVSPMCALRRSGVLQHQDESPPNVKVKLTKRGAAQDGSKVLTIDGEVEFLTGGVSTSSELEMLSYPSSEFVCWMQVDVETDETDLALPMLVPIRALIGNEQLEIEYAESVGASIWRSLDLGEEIEFAKSSMSVRFRNSGHVPCSISLQVSSVEGRLVTWLIGDMERLGESEKRMVTVPPNCTEMLVLSNMTSLEKCKLKLVVVSGRSGELCSEITLQESDAPPAGVSKRSKSRTTEEEDSPRDSRGRRSTFEEAAFSPMVRPPQGFPERKLPRDVSESNPFDFLWEAVEVKPPEGMVAAFKDLAEQEKLEATIGVTEEKLKRMNEVLSSIPQEEDRRNMAAKQAVFDMVDWKKTAEKGGSASEGGADWKDVEKVVESMQNGTKSLVDSAMRRRNEGAGESDLASGILEDVIGSDGDGLGQLMHRGFGSSSGERSFLSADEGKQAAEETRYGGAWSREGATSLPGVAWVAGDGNVDRDAGAKMRRFLAQSIGAQDAEGAGLVLASLQRGEDPREAGSKRTTLPTERLEELAMLLNGVPDDEIGMFEGRLKKKIGSCAEVVRTLRAVHEDDGLHLSVSTSLSFSEEVLKKAAEMVQQVESRKILRQALDAIENQCSLHDVRKRLERMEGKDEVDVETLERDMMAMRRSKTVDLAVGRLHALAQSGRTPGAREASDALHAVRSAFFAIETGAVDEASVALASVSTLGLEADDALPFIQRGRRLGAELQQRFDSSSPRGGASRFSGDMGSFAVSENLQRELQPLIDAENFEEDDFRTTISRFLDEHPDMSDGSKAEIRGLFDFGDDDKRALEVVNALKEVGIHNVAESVSQFSNVTNTISQFTAFGATSAEEVRATQGWDRHPFLLWNEEKKWRGSLSEAALELAKSVGRIDSHDEEMLKNVASFVGGDGEPHEHEGAEERKSPEEPEVDERETHTSAPSSPFGGRGSPPSSSEKLNATDKSLLKKLFEKVLQHRFFGSCRKAVEVITEVLLQLRDGDDRSRECIGRYSLHVANILATVLRGKDVTDADKNVPSLDDVLDRSFRLRVIRNKEKSKEEILRDGMKVGDPEKMLRSVVDNAMHADVAVGAGAVTKQALGRGTTKDVIMAQILRVLAQLKRLPDRVGAELEKGVERVLSLGRKMEGVLRDPSSATLKGLAAEVASAASDLADVLKFVSKHLGARAARYSEVLRRVHVVGSGAAADRDSKERDSAMKEVKAMARDVLGPKFYSEAVGEEIASGLNAALDGVSENDDGSLAWGLKHMNEDLDGAEECVRRFCKVVGSIEAVGDGGKRMAQSIPVGVRCMKKAWASMGDDPSTMSFGQAMSALGDVASGVAGMSVFPEQVRRRADDVHHVAQTAGKVAERIREAREGTNAKEQTERWADAVDETVMGMERFLGRRERDVARRARGAFRPLLRARLAETDTELVRHIGDAVEGALTHEKDRRIARAVAKMAVDATDKTKSRREQAEEAMRTVADMGIVGKRESAALRSMPEVVNHLEEMAKRNKDWSPMSLAEDAKRLAMSVEDAIPDSQTKRKVMYVARNLPTSVQGVETLRELARNDEFQDLNKVGDALRQAVAAIPDERLRRQVDRGIRAVQKAKTQVDKFRENPLRATACAALGEDSGNRAADALERVRDSVAGTRERRAAVGGLVSCMLDEVGNRTKNKRTKRILHGCSRVAKFVGDHTMDEIKELAEEKWEKAKGYISDFGDRVKTLKGCSESMDDAADVLDMLGRHREAEYARTAARGMEMADRVHDIATSSETMTAGQVFDASLSALEFGTQFVAERHRQKVRAGVGFCRVARDWYKGEAGFGTAMAATKLLAGSILPPRQAAYVSAACDIAKHVHTISELSNAAALANGWTQAAALQAAGSFVAIAAIAAQLCGAPPEVVAVLNFVSAAIGLAYALVALGPVGIALAVVAFALACMGVFDAFRSKSKGPKGGGGAPGRGGKPGGGGEAGAPNNDSNQNNGGADDPSAASAQASESNANQSTGDSSSAQGQSSSQNSASAASSGGRGDPSSAPSSKPSDPAANQAAPPPADASEAKDDEAAANPTRGSAQNPSASRAHPPPTAGSKHAGKSAPKDAKEPGPESAAKDADVQEKKDPEEEVDEEPTDGRRDRGKPQQGNRQRQAAKAKKQQDPAREKRKPGEKVDEDAHNDSEEEEDEQEPFWRRKRRNSAEEKEKEDREQSALEKKIEQMRNYFRDSPIWSQFLEMLGCSKDDDERRIARKLMEKRAADDAEEEDVWWSKLSRNLEFEGSVRFQGATEPVSGDGGGPGEGKGGYSESGTGASYDQSGSGDQGSGRGAQRGFVQGRERREESKAADVERKDVDGPSNERPEEDEDEYGWEFLEEETIGRRSRRSNVQREVFRARNQASSMMHESEGASFSHATRTVEIGVDESGKPKSTRSVYGKSSKARQRDLGRLQALFGAGTTRDHGSESSVVGREEIGSVEEAEEEDPLEEEVYEEKEDEEEEEEEGTDEVIAACFDKSISEMTVDAVLERARSIGSLRQTRGLSSRALHVGTMNPTNRPQMVENPFGRGSNYRMEESKADAEKAQYKEKEEERKEAEARRSTERGKVDAGRGKSKPQGTTARKSKKPGDEPFVRPGESGAKSRGDPPRVEVDRDAPNLENSAASVFLASSELVNAKARELAQVLMSHGPAKLRVGILVDVSGSMGHRWLNNAPYGGVLGSLVLLQTACGLAGVPHTIVTSAVNHAECILRPTRGVLSAEDLQKVLDAAWPLDKGSSLLEGLRCMFFDGVESKNDLVVVLSDAALGDTWRELEGRKSNVLVVEVGRSSTEESLDSVADEMEGGVGRVLKCRVGTSQTLNAGLEAVFRADWVTNLREMLGDGEPVGGDDFEGSLEGGLFSGELFSGELFSGDLKLVPQAAVGKLLLEETMREQERDMTFRRGERLGNSPQDMAAVAKVEVKVAELEGGGEGGSELFASIPHVVALLSALVRSLGSVLPPNAPTATIRSSHGSKVTTKGFLAILKSNWTDTRIFDVLRAAPEREYRVGIVLDRSGRFDGRSFAGQVQAFALLLAALEQLHLDVFVTVVVHDDARVYRARHPLDSSVSMMEVFNRSLGGLFEERVYGRADGKGMVRVADRDVVHAAALQTCVELVTSDAPEPSAAARVRGLTDVVFDITHGYFGRGAGNVVRELQEAAKQDVLVCGISMGLEHHKPLSDTFASFVQSPSLHDLPSALLLFHRAPADVLLSHHPDCVLRPPALPVPALGSDLVPRSKPTESKDDAGKDPLSSSIDTPDIIRVKLVYVVDYTGPNTTKRAKAILSESLRLAAAIQSQKDSTRIQVATQIILYGDYNHPYVESSDCPDPSSGFIRASDSEPRKKHVLFTEKSIVFTEKSSDGEATVSKLETRINEAVKVATKQRDGPRSEDVAEDIASALGVAEDVCFGKEDKEVKILLWVGDAPNHGSEWNGYEEDNIHDDRRNPHCTQSSEEFKRRIESLLQKQVSILYALTDNTGVTGIFGAKTMLEKWAEPYKRDEGSGPKLLFRPINQNGSAEEIRRQIQKAVDDLTKVHLLRDHY